ncbi:MAG: phosphoglycerate kinase [Candidatus Scalindua sp.]|nr:phosphoglycerate kinase [Candidatus Scalindua sp.]MCR4343720.1 phosphoglycerate kinase [Candidatus Scalindua sp.]
MNTDLNSKYLIASDFLNELRGKIVLVKSDFNVPIHDGAVVDDYRIARSAPFIKKLLVSGAIPLLATHLGRPKGYDQKYSLDVIVDSVSSNLGHQAEIIRFDEKNNRYHNDQLSRDYIQKLIEGGKISILDNIRFHPDEQRNKGGLAKALAGIIDLSIQNAFGTAHRTEDTSNYIHTLVPGLAGDLLHVEIEGHKEIKKPNSPYTVIVGGDKVKDSLNLVRRILWAVKTSHQINSINPELMTSIGESLVDSVLVGGHLMNAFIYAQVDIANDSTLVKLKPEAARNIRGLRNQSFLEEYNLRSRQVEEEVRLAKGLLRLYNNYQIVNQFKGDSNSFDDFDIADKRRLIIPVDYSVLRSGKKADLTLFELNNGDHILDIGTRTKRIYDAIISRSRTIVWNGSMGTDENECKEGTRSIIDSIHKNKAAVKERGGGTTNYMVSDYESEKAEQFDLGFKSTGGGATLLETVLDSPVTVCLRMSFQKLIRGGYDPKFRYLRDAVSISYLLAK